MPRDIHVFLEIAIDSKWQLALKTVLNKGFNSVETKQNRISDSMYLTESYPEYFYIDYNPRVWELFGVEGMFSANSRDIPGDCCSEISDYYASFGKESFDSHWITCVEFIENVKNSGILKSDAEVLVDKIYSLGDPKNMRLILWFSQ